MSEAILMAYVDEELGARERAAIEAEIAGDAELARRAERQRRLRAVVQAAYGHERGRPALETPLVLPIATGRRLRRSWWRRLFLFGR